MSRKFSEIQNDILLSHSKPLTKMAYDDDELDDTLISQAESHYAQVERALRQNADFIAGMKPSHAESNQELKESIAECRKLLSLLGSLRYIGM